jgi:hypothetical protein
MNIDYHIVFDTNPTTAVPYNLVQELVEVRSTPTDLTGILYQSDREYISGEDWVGRASVSPFACL